jgi:hypothetical protein
MRLDSIQVSIDGSRAEIHDASRGAGSFEKAIRGLRLLKAADFPATARETVNGTTSAIWSPPSGCCWTESAWRGSARTTRCRWARLRAREDIVLLPEQRSEAMRTLARLEREYPAHPGFRGIAGLVAQVREMEEAKATGRKTRRWKMGACLPAAACSRSWRCTTTA